MVDRRLLVTYAGGFIGPLAGNTILALIGSLKEAFGVGAGEILLSIPVYMIPFVIFQLFSGTISDSLGRKTVAASGFLIYAVGSVLCGWAPDLAFFLGGRFVQGLGFAFVTPVLHAIVGDFTTDERRGVSMGIFGAVTAGAVSAGPLIAGFMDKIDWRWTFYLIALLALLVFVAIQIAFRGVEEKRTREKSDISIRKVATDPCVIALCLAGFLTFFVFIGVISYTSDVLSIAPYSYDSATIGMVLFAGGIGGVFISPFAGLLVDKIGRFRTGTIGFVFTSLGMLIFYFSYDLWHFILAMVVVGCAAAVVWASLLTLTVEIIPERRGAVSSLFNSSRFAGYAISPVLFAGIYFSMGVRPLYIASALLTLLGIVIMAWMMILLGKRR
ncbi:MAG: MFS transporter [Thermoplasmata archaeon]|nr:MFS transporter [Thermoplasmata archaeon]